MKKTLSSLIGILGGVFWCIIMLSFSNIKMTAMTIIAALMHESGHVLILSLMRKKYIFPKAVVSGLRIKSLSTLSYKEEIWVCAAGPLVNIILYAFFVPHSQEFSIINLATAISNLLPLPGYDGYKILSNLISLVFGPKACECIMPHLSLLVSASMVFLSLFFILLLNGGYWIFSIFFILMHKEIIFFQKKTKSEDS